MKYFDIKMDGDNFSHKPANEHLYRADERARNDHRFGLISFRNSQLNNEYLRFKVASTPCFYAVITSTLLSIYLVFYWTLVLMHHADSFSIILSILTAVLAIAPLWVIYCIRAQFPSVQEESELPLNSKTVQCLRWLECFAVVGNVLTFALIQIMRTVNSPCAEPDFFHLWYCLPFYNCASIFCETLMMLTVLPLLLSIILPYAPFVLIIASFAAAIAIMCISAAMANAPMSAIWITCTVTFYSMMLMFYQRQQIQLFLFTKRYKRMVEMQERNRRQRATKLADEMRNMVANISHDLKSPLAGIVCGMELIRESCSKWGHNTSNSRDLLASNSSDDTHLTRDNSLLQMIDKSLQGMEASYYFMLVTINRSTHFTKTLHHLPLLPIVGSVDIPTVVHKVKSIVCTLQTEVKVDLRFELSEKGKENVSIITDKQWLLDNLLCLISNAVKYSKERQAPCQVLVKKLDNIVCPFKDRPHLAYCEPEGIGTIGTIGTKGKEWISFEVLDEGPGLQPEEAQALFEAPDFREQRSMGGAGLGLYCLAKRVEILEGFYGIRKCDASEQQRGLVFWFALPFSSSAENSPRRRSPAKLSTELYIIRDEEVNEAATEMLPVRRVDSSEEVKESPPTTASFEAQHPPTQSQPITTVLPQPSPRDFHLKILLVDDALPVLKMLQMMLESNGHRVVSAGNGREAVGILYPEDGRRESFDVVLMDLQMPVMDGFEAICTIRSQERHQFNTIRQPEMSHSSSQLSVTTLEQCFELSDNSAIPQQPHEHTIIIAMSANSDHVSMQRAFVAGADNFIAKPFKMEKFNDALQTCWEASQLHQL